MRRWEPAVMEKMGRFMGYRGNFEHATYQPLKGCEEMLSHSRIVSYTFAGLPVLVRFEVDAFIPSTTTQGATVEASSGPKATHDLVDMLLKMDLRGGQSQTTTANPTKDLRILDYKGNTVEHEQMLELKTRSIRAQTEHDKLYAQVIWSQTPTVIVAKHASGRFMAEERLHLADLQEEADLDESVGKVATLLKGVLDILSKKEQGYRACLVCIKGKLSLREGGCGMEYVGNEDG